MARISRAPPIYMRFSDPARELLDFQIGGSSMASHNAGSEHRLPGPLDAFRNGPRQSLFSTI
jgi:hypothetical protein